MAHKMRVHELAKELGVPVKDLLATLREIGVVVKSGGSTIERSMAQRVRAAHGTRSATGITVAELAAELGVSEPSVREVVQAMTRKSLPSDALLSDQVASQVRRRMPAAEQARPLIQDCQMASEPEHVLLAEDGSGTFHHRSYLDENSGQALCGYRFKTSPTPAGADPKISACGECAARLPEYHLIWWRARCGSLESELKSMQNLNGHLEKQCERYKQQVSVLVEKIQPSQQKGNSQRPKGASRSRGKANGPIAQRRRLATPQPAERTPADPEKVRRRLREMNAPRPPKTQEERWADEAAAERMRSQKPSAWRVGRSSSSYGNGF
ncbi:hypothetical protein CIW49_13550 [Mycolicibacterium sp. P1-18]|uniref:translation initiation factor IF-2 N-terminal domain-containing protein n=1 Tax=Mycolicibacterium sp. P1-18 TaxID=2024615 RepID=UPI0011F2F87E|nr:hypothetical protein CIW49_13550 [Mycolicibacterium sp. P1-18]